MIQWTWGRCFHCRFIRRVEPLPPGRPAYLTWIRKTCWERWEKKQKKGA